MNFLFGSNKAFFGIIIVASVVIALMMVIAKGVVTYGLELIDVILEMSDDLCHGCQLAEFSSYSDPVWESKYIYMMRREAK